MILTRRQFFVSASAAGVATGLGAFILTGDAKPAVIWRGPALGGEARISLYNIDKQSAQASLDLITTEIARLEAIFSLHNKSSEICRLNRDGRLATASEDMIRLLRSSIEWRIKTSGAFDPTVQPLWQAASDGVTVSPTLLAVCGAAVEISDNAIVLPAGTALTLNGIAQGYITDRITAILTARGFQDVVVDAGELRLIGQNRRAIGIPAAKAAVSVASLAIATSEPKLKIFDARTFRHHLIDPKTGSSPRHWESISVFAPTAEMADALSTAFAVLPHETVADLVSAIGNVAILGADGRARVRRYGDIRKIAGAAVS